MKRALCLLAMLSLLAACASEEARRNETRRPLRELFPPGLPAAPPDAQSSAAPRSPQAAAPAQQSPARSPKIARWPLTFNADSVDFRVYEPVVDGWRDDQLAMHALVLAS